jgi:putative DNA primase/helicase
MTQKPDLVLSRDTPHESAQEFRRRKYPTILKYQEDWLDYDGAAYLMIEDDTIESEIQHFLNDAEVAHVSPLLDKHNKPVLNKDGSEKMVVTYDPFNPKDNDVKQVNNALARQYHVKKGKLDPPAWLDGATDEQRKHDPKNIIACQNGLLDMTTREFLPSSPNFFTRTALAINYSESAPKPERWLTFLGEVLGDQGLIDLMQEAIGYIVSGDTLLHTIIYFRGKPRGGKGVIMRVLDNLIGDENVTNPSIADLAERSGREDLIGKSLAKITDMNTDDRNDLSKAATHLAAISGEDKVSVFRKFKKAWNGKLKCRFLLAGISLPNFGDHASSLKPRLIVFPFNVSFAGREDFKLDEKLIAELPGILNWALDGLDRLRLCERFAEPPASVIAKDAVINGSDPIRGFGTERCEFDPTFSCSKDELFADYVEYCRQIEARPFAKGAFCGKFMVAYQQVGEARPRSDGKRSHVFTGVRPAGDEHATTLVKVYKLDPVKLALGLSRYDETAILCNERGEWIEQADISGD